MHLVESNRQIIQEKRINECKDDVIEWLRGWVGPIDEEAYDLNKGN